MACMFYGFTRRTLGPPTTSLDMRASAPRRRPSREAWSLAGYHAA